MLVQLVVDHIRRVDILLVVGVIFHQAMSKGRFPESRLSLIYVE